MNVYRNTAFVTRDYETTNIVAARTNGAPPETITQLWRQTLPGGQDVRYLGYL